MLLVVLPNPEPPEPPLAVPLPAEDCGGGPAAPPPTTAVAGEPNALPIGYLVANAISAVVISVVFLSVDPKSKLAKA